MNGTGIYRDGMIPTCETGENSDEAFAVDNLGVCNSVHLWL
jgi:hypothetical protein